jgi:hypothetical protein
MAGAHPVPDPPPAGPARTCCTLKSVPNPIHLSGADFNSLEAMMRAHAEAAVQIASNDHGMVLDYSPESIPSLETILAARSPIPDDSIEDATRLWGAYFGEVFRHRYPAEWIMAVYPSQQNSGRNNPSPDVAMPALDIGGSQVYPLLKIVRRLSLGPTEDLVVFYAKVSTALDARPKKEAAPPI